MRITKIKVDVHRGSICGHHVQYINSPRKKQQQFHRNCFYMHDRIIWNSQIKMKKIISLLGEQMHRGFMIVILFLVLYGQGTDNNNNNKKA